MSTRTRYNQAEVALVCKGEVMKWMPVVFMVGAVVCGMISLIIVGEYSLVSRPSAVGAACGFAISVGLLGIAAALAHRNG